MQQGKLDLDFYFDVGTMNAECHLPDTPHDYYFQDFDASFTQLIISERVVNCFLNAVARQEMLHFNLNSHEMLRHFGTNRVKITADLLSEIYPQIAAKYGGD